MVRALPACPSGEFLQGTLNHEALLQPRRLLFVPAHIALREAGLSFDLVLASTKTKKLQDGSDFYAINSKGSVPVLELDNGERLTEGPAIVQYIADLAPASNLAPAAGSMARYRLQEWLNYITSELHKGFSPLFNPATPEDYKPLARAALMARFTWVNAQLEGKQYLMGDQFTVADAYLFVVSNWGPVRRCGRQRLRTPGGFPCPRGGPPGRAGSNEGRRLAEVI